ncbi:MAG: hypothetical protein DRP88_06190 [Candidatus Neomarinimicrobiota bacterium]|nr:MAG: hypothetical protein DRP88_06190 [Candidatus Neomarinimicrobiota bacterium]
MEKLKNILQWWFEYQIPPFIERNGYDGLLDTRLIPVLIGPRRSGKSTLFFQLISKLRKDVPSQNIVYINYEDDRLLPFEGGELAKLLDVYRQFFEVAPEAPIFLFLDEIQNVPNWEKVIRRIYETEANVKLFITGSNSKMLSSDIATALRGRTLTYKVFPLSFREYLGFKGVQVPQIDRLPYSGRKNEILFFFSQYMRYGGFPEVVLAETMQEKEAILKEYLHTVFFADIVQRYSIRQIKVLDSFIKILTRQMSCLVSMGKMAASLKSIGFKVSKSTLIEYLGYLEDAFLGKTVSIFSYSVKDQLQYPKKFYLLDNGMYQVTSFIKEKDWGRLLENMVFCHLYRKYDDLYYWKSSSGYEVDFVLPQFFGQNDEFSLIQVCYDLTSEKRETREIRALELAAKEFKVSKALIITRDLRASFERNGLEIEIKPFYQWVLE